MQAILVMFRSDGERRSFSITRDMTVIGRREDCDLRIPLGDVSRKHCRLVRDGDTLRLEDLGSSNGTFHNGQRIQEATLSPGDSVQIGPVVFVLQIDGHPADEELQPITADVTETHAAEGANDLGPLSPTSQSEVEDLIEGLDPVPEGHEHADLESPGPEGEYPELGTLAEPGENELGALAEEEGLIPLDEISGEGSAEHGALEIEGAEHHLGEHAAEHSDGDGEADLGAIPLHHEDDSEAGLHELDAPIDIENMEADSHRHPHA